MVDSKNSPIYYILTTFNQYRHPLRKYENSKHYYLDTVTDEPGRFLEDEYYYNNNNASRVCCIKITLGNAKIYLYEDDYEFYRNLMIKDLFPLDI